MPANVAAIIPASSVGLPAHRRPLAALGGQFLLARVVSRVGRAQTLTGVLIATTTEASDDEIASLCRARRWRFFRGSAEDPLDRLYRTASESGADVIVRIDADSPLIDPALIDEAVRAFIDAQPLDYLSNSLPPRTFPRGLEVEVFTVAALERAWREDQDPASRAGLTSYLTGNPKKFRTRGIGAEVDRSALRWKVETPGNLAFVREVYGHFDDDRFTWQEVLEAMHQNPRWSGTRPSTG